MKPLTVPAARFLCMCVLTSILACGSPPSAGETWLLHSGGDTVWISDAAEAWAGLDSGERNVYLTSGEASLMFTISLARKELVLKELDAMGYASSPDVVAFGESWLRVEAARVAYGFKFDEYSSGITDEDVRLYRENMHFAYWFTQEPGTAYEAVFGPVNRAELTHGTALRLDSLPEGGYTVNDMGLSVRLDSITQTDPVMVDQFLGDSTILDAAAASSIAQSRFNRWRLGALYDVRDEYAVTVDSTVLREYAAAWPGPYSWTATDIAVRSDFRDWSATEFGYEVAFMEELMPSMPNSVVWLGYLVDNLIMQCYMMEYMEDNYPGKVDSLRSKRDNWVVGFCADRMYGEMVSDVVEVTSEDIEEQYTLLEEPVMTSEMRVFETALVPTDGMPGYELAVSEGRLDEYISGLQPVLRFSADSLSPRISRPFRKTDLPGTFREECFLLDPSDTLTWLGPFSSDEHDSWMLLRLVEVQPPRVALVDDILLQLEQQALARLTEEASLQWIQGLEDRYGLVLNQEALDNLPADPGEW